MAERDQKGAKRAPRKAAAAVRPPHAPASPGSPQPDTPEDRIRALEAECERLKAALTSAEGRIAELEAQHRQTIDRIDWVIDSLHSLSDD